MIFRRREGLPEGTGVFMKHKADSVIERVLLTVIIVLAAFFAIGVYAFPDESQPEIFRCRPLGTSWQQVMDDGSLVPVEVPGKYTAKEGETATLTARLPESFDDFGGVTPWLCLRASKQDISIYIDGELRERYTTENTRLWGKNSVSAYVFVPLSEADYGKSISLSLTTDSGNAEFIREIYCGTVFGIWMNFIKQNAFEALSALFILVLAVCSIIIDGVLSAKTNSSFNLRFLGWGVLFLSLWMLAQSPLRQLYFSNISLAGHITYFSLYVCSIPLLIFINYTQKLRYAHILRPLTILSAVFFVTSIILQATNTVDFNDMLLAMYAMVVAEALCIIITFVLDAVKGLISGYIFNAVGLVGFALTMVLQMIVYFQKDVVFNTAITGAGVVFLLSMAAADTAREYAKRRREMQANRLKTEKITYQGMLTLVRAIEAKDKYTEGHSTRVGEYSRLLAKKMGMSEEEQTNVFYMATLHDIGKIGISDSILSKPGELTEEESAIIRTHPEAGYRILRNMTEIKDIEYGAKWHHERYDGTGYPDGLAGEDIPVYARIIAVADAYDAMTSSRSFRNIMPRDMVREEIGKAAGSQLDPVIAGYMIELIDEDPEYKMRQKP